MKASFWKKKCQQSQNTSLIQEKKIKHKKKKKCVWKSAFLILG